MVNPKVKPYVATFSNVVNVGEGDEYLTLHQAIVLARNDEDAKRAARSYYAAVKYNMIDGENYDDPQDITLKITVVEFDEWVSQQRHNFNLELENLRKLKKNYEDDKESNHIDAKEYEAGREDA